MARVLLAWELGGGFGHVACLKQFAVTLKAGGHACALAMRHLGSAQQLLPRDLGPLYQAPARIGHPVNPVRTQVSYASLLHNIGFSNPTELAGRIRAWRDLMRILRTQLLIADHSPLALIAARSLGIPRLAIGNGFTLPPLQAPFPSFRPRMRIGEQVLINNESAVLAELNCALELLGLPAFRSLQQLFDDTARGLLSYPELDHYPGERAEPFHGYPPTAGGAEPKWPGRGGPKLFVHLRPSRHLHALLTALLKSRARVLIKADGVPVDTLRPYLRDGLQITNEALNFQHAAQRCDAWIGTGSHGLACEQLLAGKPGLLMPGMHEQYLLARRVSELGAGLNLDEVEQHDADAALDRLLTDTAMADAAAAFGRRHARAERDRIIPELLAGVLQ